MTSESNEQILTNLVASYWDGVWAFLYSQTQNVDVTNDLAQDTFILACQRIHQVRDISRMKSWLFSIAKNRCRDHYKSAWVRKVSPQGDHRAFESVTGGLSAEQQMLSELEQSELWSAIFQLSPRLREVLLLRLREDLSFRETAEILGINESTTRSRYNRAVEKLRLRFQTGGVAGEL